MTTTERPLHVVQAEALRRQAEGLLRLADLVEATPENKASYLKQDAAIEFNVWYAPTPERLAAIARAALAHGAKVDKDPASDTYILNVSWGALTARALANRADVCERVVIGTETVTRTAPDPAAPMVEVTEEVEKVEWVCRSLLADESGKDSGQ